MAAIRARTRKLRKRHKPSDFKKLRATSEIVQNKETEPRVARIAALTNTFDAPPDHSFKENENNYPASVKRHYRCPFSPLNRAAISDPGASCKLGLSQNGLAEIPSGLLICGGLDRLFLVLVPDPGHESHSLCVRFELLEHEDERQFRGFDLFSDLIACRL